MSDALLVLSGIPHNLWNYSERFDIRWQVYHSHVSPDTAVSSDGSLTASRITEDDAVDDWHGIHRDDVFFTPGIPITFSIEVSADETTSIGLSDYFASAGCFFDLTAGTFQLGGVDSGLVLSNPAMEDLGGGWFRCSVMFTASEEGRWPSLWLRDWCGGGYVTPGGMQLGTYTGNNVDGLFLARAQLNIGPLQAYHKSEGLPYFGDPSPLDTYSSEDSSMSNITRAPGQLLPLEIGETDVLTFDYTDSLVDAETIVSAVTTISVVNGTDPSPSGLLVGTTQVATPYALQKVTGAVRNVTYLCYCAATTSTGRVLVNAGLLPVIAFGQP